MLMPAECTGMKALFRSEKKWLTDLVEDMDGEIGMRDETMIIAVVLVFVPPKKGLHAAIRGCALCEGDV